MFRVTDSSAPDHERRVDSDHVEQHLSRVTLHHQRLVEDRVVVELPDRLGSVPGDFSANARPVDADADPSEPSIQPSRCMSRPP